MTRRHAADALEERRAGIAEVHQEIVGDRGRVGASHNRCVFQQRADLGGEQQTATIPVVIERLDAERVARAEEGLRPRVPRRDREFAPGMLETCRLIESTVPDEDPSVGVRERLLVLGRCRRQAAMSETDRARDPAALAVRTPVRQRARHAADQRGVGRPPIEVHGAGDAAHRAGTGTPTIGV